MDLNDFLSNAAKFAERESKDDHVVLSSRVRLARNVSGRTFPGRAKRRIEWKLAG